MPHRHHPTTPTTPTTPALHAEHPPRFSIATLLRSGEVYTDPPASDPPPRGCGAQPSPDGDIILTASTRSLPLAVCVGVFGFVWNSVVALFVFMVGSTLLTQMGLAPQPMADIALPMPPSIAAGMLLFALPFVAIGAWLAFTFFMALGGRVVVRIGAHHGEVFTGVGGWGRRRAFDAAGVTSIRVKHGPVNNRGRSLQHIELTTLTGTHRFGSSLPPERTDWLCAAARTILVPAPRPLRQAV